MIEALPDYRQADLRQQLEFLDQETDFHYKADAVRDLARIADSQGLGGSLVLSPA
jgi:hypothetical protein